MDNKKAIDLLSMIEFKYAECCLNTWYKGIDDDMKEALEMGINALHREQQFLDAGYKNRRVEFNIGGRRFMVKELPQ